MTVGTKEPATAMRKNAHSYIQKLKYLKSCGIHWRNTLFLKSHQVLTTYLSPPASFFLTPLMRAGVDKEVWIVQLLTELLGADSPGNRNTFLSLSPPSSFLLLLRSLDIKSAFMHLAEPSVLNYLGPVPPSAFHSN